MKRVIATTLLCWLGFVFLPSIAKVRAIAAAPLIVTEEKAHGDACYVLSAGSALWERLAAAADLFHMKRVETIIIMQNNASGPYSFRDHRSRTQSEWALAYLTWQGVPREKVTMLPEVDGVFGTRNEARNLAKAIPHEVNRLVLVTSAPHTRRSLMIFRRLLPRNITVVPFAASSFESSTESNDPLWLEYSKLSVYCLFLFR